MPDVKFNCSNCNQSLEAPADMLGQLIDCPSCGQAIEVPRTQSRPSAPLPTPHKLTRPCPFCSEEIQFTAVKCKHCGEFLDKRSHQTQVSKASKPNQEREFEIWKGSPPLRYFYQDFIMGALTMLFYGIGIIFIIRAILARNTTHYLLTNKRATSKWGIIARHSSEVELQDIRNIYSEQSAMERILGLGNIEIASAGTSGAEVVFAGISDHQKVRDIIKRQKDETNPID